MNSENLKYQIVVFGGTKAFGPTKVEDMKFASQLGACFAMEFKELRIYTGGTPGFPREFAKGFCSEMKENTKTQQVIHILPSRHKDVYERTPLEYHRGQKQSNYVFRGSNMEERRTILASLKPIDFAIAMGGGPGTVDEVEKALKADTHVVFFVRSGGACAPKKERRKLPFNTGEYSIPIVYLESPLADPKSNLEEMCSFVIKEAKKLFEKKR